ncbi:MAG: MFS transporter [Alsobacter sp.]
MTAPRYVAWFFAAGGTFLDGYSVVALGIGLPLLKREFTMGPLVIGLIGAGLVLGAAFGSWLGGLSADRWGRRPVFLADMAVLAAGAFLCAWAPAAWVLVAGQFVLGLGIGMDFPTSGSYVSEMMPRAVRNRMVVATIALQSVGMVAAALVSLAILGLHPGPGDWRLLITVSGVLALVVLLGRTRLPESPRWLAGRGRFDEAVAVLRRMGDAPPSATPGGAPRPSGSVSGAGTPSPGFAVLLTPRFRARTLLVCVPWMLMDVATYGVGLFTPVILAAIHFGGPSAGSLLAADIVDAEGSAVVDLFLLVGFVVGILLVPRIGRIPMQVAGFGGMTLGMLVLLFASLTHDSAAMNTGLVIAGFVLFNLAMNAGPNATTFALAPTLFPTALRGSASGLAAASAKVGATFGTFAVPQLHATLGIAGVLGLMAAVSAGGLIVTASLAHVVNEEGAIEEGEAGLG